MSCHSFSIGHPLITLWIIALLAGIGWRAELELRTGWASLNWIGQFHWAIPIGVFAFILWVLGVTRVQRPPGLCRRASHVLHGRVCHRGVPS